MSIEELGGVEGPIFFGPDLQLGLSAEIWNFGLELGLPAGPPGQTELETGRNVRRVRILLLRKFT